MQYDQKQEAYRVEGLVVGTLDKCFDKCVEPSWRTEKDLTGDEARCIDMCSWKYMNTHKAIDAALARAQVSPTGAPEQKHVRR